MERNNNVAPYLRGRVARAIGRGASPIGNRGQPPIVPLTVSRYALGGYTQPRYFDPALDVQGQAPNTYLQQHFASAAGDHEPLRNPDNSTSGLGRSITSPLGTTNRQNEAFQDPRPDSEDREILIFPSITRSLQMHVVGQDPLHWRQRVRIADTTVGDLKQRIQWSYNVSSILRLELFSRPLGPELDLEPYYSLVDDMADDRRVITDYLDERQWRFPHAAEYLLVAHGVHRRWAVRSEVE